MARIVEHLTSQSQMAIIMKKAIMPGREDHAQVRISVAERDLVSGGRG